MRASDHQPRVGPQHSDRGEPYRATTAHALAYHRASRPKPAKLVTNMALRRKVEQDLQRHYSPEQIAGRLLREFPDDAEMRVSNETIYQSLYVQSRGALRRDLARCLRTGRALRRPCRKFGQRKNRIPDMINISRRPAEADERAVPAHWEGDLIIGTKNLRTHRGNARPTRTSTGCYARTFRKAAPFHSQRPGPRVGRRRAQRPAPQAPGLRQADRGDRTLLLR